MATKIQIVQAAPDPTLEAAVNADAVQPDDALLPEASVAVNDTHRAMLKAESDRNRSPSTIPSFMLRYIVPFATLLVRQVPNFEVKVIHHKRVSAVDLPSASGYAVSFTVEQRTRASTSDEEIVLAPGSVVDVVGIRLDAQFAPWGTNAEIAFQNDAQVIEAFTRVFQLIDYTRSVDAQRLPVPIAVPLSALHRPHPPPPAPKLSDAQRAALQVFRDKLRFDFERPALSSTHFLFENMHRLEDWYALQLKGGLNNEVARAVLGRLDAEVTAVEDERQRNLQEYALQLQLSEKKHLALGQFNKALHRLTAKERGVVDALYDRQRRSRDESTARDVSTALSNAIQFLDWKRIRELRQQGEACPHLVELADALLSNSGREHSDLFDRVTHKYGVAIEYARYCRHCGEKLEVIAEEDVTIASLQEYVGNDGQETERMIFPVISRILSQYTLLNVKWLAPTQLTRFITSIITPPLEEIHSGLLRVKGVDVDAVWDIYIAAHAFAVLAHLIFLHPTNVSFKESRRGGRAGPSSAHKADERKLLVQSAGRLFLHSRQVELLNNPVLNQKSAILAFGKAYNWALTVDFSALDTKQADTNGRPAAPHPLERAAETSPMFAEYKAERLIEEPAYPKSAKLVAFESKYAWAQKRNYEQWRQSKLDYAKPVRADAVRRRVFNYEAVVATIRKARPKDKRRAFFALYEHHCPEGDLHEMEDKRCSKCKVTPQQLLDKDDGFFQKYESHYLQYEKQRNESIQADFASVLRPVDAVTPDAYKAPAPLGDVDNSVIMEASKELSMVPAVFFSLGLFEQVRFEDVTNGKVTPYVDLGQAEASMRNQLLRNHIQQTKRSYNACRNVEEFHVLPKEYVALLKDQLTRGFADLPPIPESFSGEVIERLIFNRDSVKAGYHLLLMLAQLIVFALGAFRQNGHHDFAKHFARYLAQTILDNEKVMALFQLKHIKASLIEDVDTSKEDYDVLVPGDDEAVETADATAADTDEDVEEAAPSMQEVDFDEEFDDEHFEVDLRDKED